MITSGLTSIPIDINTTLTAATVPAFQFVIVELPPAAPAGNYHFTFQITSSAVLGIKALLAGKVQISGKTYYTPTMPCVTDFASVPGFVFPAPNMPPASLLTDAYLANIQGCNNKVFMFPAITTPAAVDVIEFYNAGLDHYFITYGAQEISDLDTGVHKGWARTGQSFKAFVTPQAGTSPVCRFYIPPAQRRLAFLRARDGGVQRDGCRASRFRPRGPGVHADVPAGRGRVSGQHDRGVSRVQQPGGCQPPVHDRPGDPGSDGRQGLDNRR